MRSAPQKLRQLGLAYYAVRKGLADGSRGRLSPWRGGREQQVTWPYTGAEHLTNRRCGHCGLRSMQGDGEVAEGCERDIDTL